MIKQETMHHSIDLHIPRQEQSNIPPAFDCRPTAVEKWVTELPVANIGETARLVYNALTEINRAELADKNRLAILEQLRAPIAYLSETLAKHYLGASFPLTLKRRKVASLASELLAQMAIGYKIIVANSDVHGARHLNIERLSTAIYRAMDYLGEVILTAYQIYSPVPDNTWKDIHQLYKFAEQSNLLLSPIKDPVHRHNTKQNINNLYGRIVLLAVASPYRLSQTQIINLSKTLETWALQCKISKPDHYNTISCDFIIRLDADEHPTHLVFNDLDENENYRILDTSGLTNIIRDQISQTARRPGYEKENHFSQDMLHSLMLSWGLVPKRGVPRTNKTKKLFISFGLSSTHSIISSHGYTPEGAHDVLTLPQFTTRSQFTSQAIRSLNESEPDVWDMVYLDPSFHASEKNLLPDNNVSLYKTHKCIVTNESAGGICLRWKCETSSLARVGELAGLSVSEKKDGIPWDIGVIRWMKSLDNDELELGIQILASMAIPVATCLHSTDKITRYYQRSLLIPELKSLRQHATLITPAGMYKPADIITINGSDSESKVQLTHATEATEGYTRFLFTIIEATASTDDRQAGTQRNADFGSLWTSL